ncbi:Alpha/Beta hydrolase protein [Chytriomyces sp. MP71]|nr:Alpha/Beta hydrolase protein [Chytriomyces sp. MP71]
MFVHKLDIQESILNLVYIIILSILCARFLSGMLFVHTPVRCGTFVAEADTSGPSARLYYEMHGEADIEHTRRRIVLVNGVSQSCRMWGLALNYLKDGASQIVVFDNRGVGDSDQSSDALRAPTMTRFGADIAALISHLHWDAHTDRIPLFLIGFSMGGMAALQAVSRMPSNTLKGLALINTSAGGWWNLLPSIPLLWILLKAALGLIPVKTQCDLIKFMILRTFPQSWLMASPPPKSIYSGYSTNGEFISRKIVSTFWSDQQERQSRQSQVAGRKQEL